MTTETSFAPHSRRRRWPWVSLALALIIVAGTQAYRLSLQAQARRELNALRQEGIPASPQELEDWHGPVADKENAAIRILEASDYLALAPNEFRESRWPSRTEELGPEERDEFHEILTNNAPALEALHVAARLQKSQFPVDYSLGPNTLLPHLAKVKSLTQLLRAEATIYSEEGRPDAAVQSVIDSVALARSLDDEPLLISQLVRMACFSISCSTLERLLTQHALSEAQLDALAAALRGAREASKAAFRGAYAGELCLGVYCFQAPPAEILRAIEPDSEVSAWAQGLFPLYAWTGLRDRDFLFFLRTLHQMLDIAKMPYPDGLRATEDIGRTVEQGIAGSRLLIFSKMLLPSLQRTAVKSAESEARLRCAETTLQVERYRVQKKGVLPENLDELGPALASIALDPFDGEPLRYQKLEPGFVVYSLGPDGTDEGGTERRRKGSSGARIWPPSKPGEETGQRSSSPAATQGHDITFTVER